MLKKAFLLTILLPVAFAAQSQFISQVLDYKPGPGQFINTLAWGLPSTANSLIGTTNGGVSLGAFGGYVIFKFDNPVENHANNPYGVDFVIYGNPLENLSTPEMKNNVTWSEPGIVSVMKDENNNGLPDDTWYELAGSDYFFSTTIKNYSITYTNPGGNIATDIPWTDNQGNTAYVYANTFHSQTYYPLHENFTNVDAVSYTLSGTRIKDFVDQSNPSYITAAGRPWGYADNNLRNSYNGLPDNPYTDNIEEGSGGDAFDISWAVDSNGNYVDLDKIDFIKVHNATMADAGWLGEVSTEITGAFDVEPNPVENWESTSLVLNNIPILVSLNDSYKLEATFFKNGRKVDVGGFRWNATPENLVNIDENNMLTIKSAGTITLTVLCQYKGEFYTESMEATIVAPSSIEINEVSTTFRVGEKYPIDALVADQNNKSIANMNLVWETSNSSIGVLSEENKSYLTGLQIGTSWLSVYPNGYPELKDSVQITILESLESNEVYLSIKTINETVFETSKISVSNFDLTPFVQNPNHNYDIGSVSNITAAHAIASVFENVAFESDLRYRDTEKEGLYIYKLPVLSGTLATNYYGYGNLGEEDENYSCWMVQIGDKTYYKNLENVQLFSNDYIKVYYVEDIRQNWTVNELKSSAYEVRAGNEVEITLSALSLFLYSGTTVMEESRVPVANSTVLVNNSVHVQNSIALQTNSDGKAMLKIEETGIYEVSAGGESFTLKVTPGTSVKSYKNDAIAVSPIPAQNIVHISATNIVGGTQVKVFELGGKLIYQDVITSHPNGFDIETSQWENGVYLLQVANKKQTTKCKIIIQH